MKNMLSEQERQAVKDILILQLGVEQSQLLPDAKIQADLGADSLDVIEIIMAVEERFDLSIPDEAAEKVLTTGDLFEMLEDLAGKRR